MNKCGSTVATVALLLCIVCTQASAVDASEWIATWAASDMPAGTSSQKIATLENFTIRQVVTNSIGGESLRLRISNVFGDKPLVIGGATVAVRGDAAAVIPATLKTVTFAGSAATSIPAGEFRYSDPVALPTDDFAQLAVSLHFPQVLPSITRHGSASDVSYISDAGNFAMSETMPVRQETNNAVFLTGIEVAAGSKKLIVCFGDSITEGAGVEQSMDWPALLAKRLAGEAAVINQGITGNRLLHDFAGESALKRFQRDVLSWQNLDYVVVAIGINDLGYPALDDGLLPSGVHESEVGVDDMIAGYRQLIAAAHASGVVIVGTTLIPFEGANYFSEDGEATRLAINQWIRENNEFDAVIDFDRIVRDPTQPDQLGPGFHDDEDWLHPNAEGYKAMAGGIDLSIFD